MPMSCSSDPSPSVPHIAAASRVLPPDGRAAAATVGGGAGRESEGAAIRLGGCARTSDTVRKPRRDDDLAARLPVSGGVRNDRIGLSPAQ